MDQKAFFEVFPELEIRPLLRGQFEETQVERITANARRDRYTVYITSGHLIHYRDICRMQEILASQVFARCDKQDEMRLRPIEVRIKEHYHLSERYTPRYLLEEYAESMAEELGGSSQVATRYFREAAFKYPSENEVVLELKEGSFAEDYSVAMTDYVTRVLRERCGLAVNVQVEFLPEEELEVLPGRKREGGLTPSFQDLASDEPLGKEGNAAGSVSYDSADAYDAALADSAAAYDLQASDEVPFEETDDPQPRPFRPREDAPKPAAQANSSAGPNRKAARDENAITKGKKGKARGYKRSDDPDLIYGREVKEDPSPIADIMGEGDQVVVRGEIIAVDRRDITNARGNTSIMRITLTDDTDSISCKFFVETEFADEVAAQLSVGSFVKVKGTVKEDSYEKEELIGVVSGIMKSSSFRVRREDHYATKRVELHCHTKMSEMDALTEASKLVKRAYEWGWPAIAITDHGNVQAFPDAYHTWDGLFKKENGRRKEEGLAPIATDEFFKVIYGVECYLVDDMRPIVRLSEGILGSEVMTGRPVVVFDLETTGLSANRDHIIEFGAVRLEGGEITSRYSTFVDPRMPIPYNIQKLTGISDDMVAGAPGIREALEGFLAFSKGAILVGHNVNFDAGFVRAAAKRLEIPGVDPVTVDTMELARAIFQGRANYRLETVAKWLDVSLENHHRAVDDAECTAEIYQKLMAMPACQSAVTFDALNALGESTPENVRHMNPLFHCILLAQNEIGRIHLYTLISQSHLTYFGRKPRIPKSLLTELREGILVGSACVSGELFQAVLEERSDEQIAEIASFYDYFEIQPIGNNRFLLEATDREGNKRYPYLTSEEDLQELNRRIVQLGERMGKPVCATCDVHFMEPEEEIYRTILQASMKMGAEEEPAPLYLRTTDEMIAEFAYLGQTKCEEVVIRNPRMIAEMIRPMSPVRPDKCPPVIENSDETLREICHNRARELYGDPLPEVVSARLERELTSIISNGYSVMYIIAQKLVWKSNEDGYLVGSRGSVGSSFVATMAGITEVNPLPAHYYCPHCHYSDFDSELVRSYADKCGIDLPRKMCPVCGEPLCKDGFNIPFETFLGFKGDKEPDIDLNFSGEYQSKAHAYTKVIFGADQTFKAGTVGTIADKTAYGYVRGYFEDRGIHKRRCELDRMKSHLEGVRRSTGQHPGGIVVLPVGEDINSFTPVQHPANDMESEVITTHFDYHSIDHNLLKLDILGHDDPTMIRMLQDLTGIDPLTIPLDDPDTMKIFRGTEVLGITPEDLGGISKGTLGVPEFGTRFVIQMLEDTMPTTFSELVRISGLSHGTDVWLGNAQTLIQEGKATLPTAICCRDDIMIYLISQGVEASMSFKIMESVRKGKGLSPEMTKAMEAANIPDWYMDSCRKIAYMFPRAHAAAYVMMAIRIAYCKVHHPLAYYAAYFSIRSKDFDYEIMAQGKAHLKSVMADYEHRKDKLTAKEEATYGDMQNVLEFYARGFEFLPISLEQAGGRDFRIIDGKLMPSFNSINGLGEKAADSVAAAVKDGPFSSRDNFRARTKLSKNLVDLMDELGILKGLPETDQISIFDLMG